MYPNNFRPYLHDIVFVQLIHTNKTNDTGNYVKLVEYDNIEGLVLCTEITKYKSNLKSLVKPDEIFPVVIISTSNGYDLSYSKIKHDQRQLLKDCYTFQEKIYKLIKKISTELNITNDIIELILKYNLNPKIYVDSNNSNKNLCEQYYYEILNNSDILFDKFQFNVDNIKVMFKNQIKSHLEIKPYHVIKEFKLSVYDNNSLDKLKSILNKIKNISNNQENLTYILECKSSPIYQYKLVHDKLEEIEKYIKNIDESITNICSEYNCVIEIKENYDIIKKGDILFN
jgi:translation initiation factor 2 subunit 1